MRNMVIPNIMIPVVLIFLISGCVSGCDKMQMDKGIPEGVETIPAKAVPAESYGTEEQRISEITIDSYSFGSIVISGKEYGDIKIYDNKIVSWQYTKHHTVTKEDIVEIIMSKPDILVIGTGYYDKVKVEQEAIDFLNENNTDFIVKNTSEAYKDYNKLVKEGRKAAAILHSTC